MPEISKDNLLRSWKDISAYLGCDVRTCHRWEQKHGMPVHRAEGGEKKSPVFAYKDELDAWFKGTFRSSGDARGQAGRARPGRSYLKWLVAAAAVVVLAGGGLLLWETLLRGQPADFRIEGSVLVVLDKGGRELWRADTGMEDLKPESYYKAHFQVIDRQGDPALPAIVMKDIDGDGDAEVIFAPKRRGDQTGEGELFCYDRRGKELWRFRAGRELRCPGKVYSPDYRVQGFHCRDLDRDGRLETLVFSYQAPDWPCQMAVLDASGRLAGEYWNAGYLFCPAYHDLDGDGREEILVGGVNNEYKGGCLIVFDTRRIAGGSPQSGRFACEGWGPGTQRYYVIVPYTDVSDAMGVVVEGFNDVLIQKNSTIRAIYGVSLFYEFDFGLKCLQVDWGHGYINQHGDMVRAGRITSVLDGAYAAALLAGVRYWDGSAWTAEPSLSN
jgi:hypothetical protein